MNMYQYILGQDGNQFMDTKLNILKKYYINAYNSALIKSPFYSVHIHSTHHQVSGPYDDFAVN